MFRGDLSRAPLAELHWLSSQHSSNGRFAHAAWKARYAHAQTTKISKGFFVKSVFTVCCMRLVLCNMFGNVSQQGHSCKLSGQKRIDFRIVASHGMVSYVGSVLSVPRARPELDLPGGHHINCTSHMMVPATGSHCLSAAWSARHPLANEHGCHHGAGQITKRHQHGETGRRAMQDTRHG